MEAYEEKDIKRDSFEEVNRILAIVETSKKDFESAKSRLSYILLVTVSTLLIVGTGGIVFMGNADKEMLSSRIIDEKIFLFISCILTMAGSFALIKSIQLYNQNRSEYKTIASQATEIIREITPALARSENWSTLRKFELLLRLSKLGIRTDRIFEPGFGII